MLRTSSCMQSRPSNGRRDGISSPIFLVRRTISHLPSSDIRADSRFAIADSPSPLFHLPLPCYNSPMLKDMDDIRSRLIEEYDPDKIILFGSRARGNFRSNSDIDLALDAGRKLELEELGQIQNLIEALNIPQMVDIADMHRVPSTLKENILREGIVWKD